jgi:hypothetical protein
MSMSAEIIEFRASDRTYPPSQTRVIRAMEGMPYAVRAAFAGQVAALHHHHPVLAARPERERRRKLWLKAENLYRFYDGLREIAMVADRAFEEYGCEEAKSLAPYAQTENWHRLIGRWRAAARLLMLTPAPCMAELSVKRRMRSQLHDGIDNATAEKIDALIDADKAWLLANAVHRSKRRNKLGSVRSSD